MWVMDPSAKWYGKAILNAFGGESAGEASFIDWLSDTIKVALTTSAYTPDQDAHEFFADVTSEVVGVGYTAGGATLGSKTLAYTAAGNIITFDADNVSWDHSKLAARYAVLYKHTGSGATSPLLGYVDFGYDVLTSGGTFQITWNDGGIFRIQAA